jgi:hypothetical protein
MFEENLLGLDRVLRFVYVVRPYLSTDMQQGILKGHIIAFPSAGPDALKSCLISMDAIPDVMSAVFIMVRDDDTDMAAMVERARMFDVRGPEVAKWAVHLSQVSFVLIYISSFESI